jgi:Domain of unknown function (DUF5063)
MVSTKTTQRSESRETVESRDPEVNLRPEDFAARASAFIEFVERAGALALPDRLRAVRAQLVDVYAAALSLPLVDEVDVVDEVDAPTSPIPVCLDFGAHDEYWEVFDPYIEGEPLIGSLSDDVGDVYADLAGGLALWTAGHRDAAVWEWRFAFDTHWGDHAVDALRALHRACKPS